MITELRKAIETELEKFRTHNCLIMAIYNGQHLVPMKWIFSIKTDGTYKARLRTPNITLINDSILQNSNNYYDLRPLYRVTTNVVV